MDISFVECPTCSDKPGTPRLCGSCLHNREVISLLGEKTTKLSQTHEKQLAHLKNLNTLGLMMLQQCRRREMELLVELEAKTE